MGIETCMYVLTRDLVHTHEALSHNVVRIITFPAICKNFAVEKHE